MAGFALSCFGLLLFLWLAFGGPIPLKPKGYRVHGVVPRGDASSPRRPTCASPACRSARSRRSSPTRRRAARTSTIQLDARYAPLPADTKAILRQKTLLGETYVELTPGTPRRAEAPRGRAAARPRRCRRRSSSTRSSARSTRRRARRSRCGCRRRRGRSRAAARDLNDALGNLAPFAEDTNELLEILNRQEGAVQRLVAQHRRGVRRADRARRPAARADRELQPRVRDDRRAQPASCRRRSGRCRRSSASRARRSTG